ncbi:DUF2857 domain-containing protein [Pseudomonas aeruginosa]|uniref:DUF2857 domain-containing protein n=1 Tax=Pseudomonas aeruginosa TaxID=287 RepID=UPI000F7ECC3E|nr:DUF2857 domain-containing protein [Pseudomonas aeruginosa]RTB44084.1 DUF2857 domain-containing protein [Pseudomonas aeruginosa]
MSHPLNQAVIAQALHDLRNGQLRRAQSMGFGERELAALKHPTLVSLLANASVAWCTVQINQEVIQRLLEQVADLEREIAVIDRMLELGSSTEMVSQFYGLTHQEIALRREVLGLQRRKGRHPVLTEPQEQDLWRLWRAEADKRAAATDDDFAQLAIVLDLAEGTGLPASVVWGALRSWIDQGLT